MKLAFWKKSDQLKSIEPSPVDSTNNNTMIFKAVFGLVIFGLVINFVLLWLLNSKVTTLREDKSLMSETINRASSIMDKNSGTSYAKELTVESLANKETFQNALGILTKQATLLTKERDSLASTLGAISLSIDKANAQKEPQLSDINSYEQSSKAVLDQSKKSLDTNSKLATFIAEIAGLLGQTIPDVNEFIIKSKISADPILLKSMIDAVTNNKQQLSVLTDEVSSKNEVIAQLNNSVKDTSGNNNELKKLFNEQRRELERVKAEHEELKTKVAQSDDFDDEDSEDQASGSSSQEPVKNEARTVFPEYYYKLKGKVVEYNTKWGFIILDFGSDSKLNLDIDGSMREVTVPAPLGQELYIARGDQFVAKAKIVNVYAKYAVANVIFPTNDQIVKGDSVFFDQPTIINSVEKKN